MISLNFKTTYHRNTQNPQVVQKCLEFVQSDLSTITCLTTSSLQRFGSQTKAAETLAVLGDKLEDAPCRERVVLTNFNYPHRTSRVRITGRTIRLVCDKMNISSTIENCENRSMQTHCCTFRESRDHRCWFQSRSRTVWRCPPQVRC